jgi:hypothetical protein
MQKGKNTGLFFRSGSKTLTPFKIITPVLLVVLLFASMVTPSHALTPARDLTGTWKSGVSEKYYMMDSFDGTTPEDDITATFECDITQQGSQISIVFYSYPTSWITDNTYYQEYGPGIPPASGGDILFEGTVSGASFTADEYPYSSSTQEHLSGTFTTDIITATLTGLLYTSDTNGIIVLRSGSSATMPPTTTPAPTPTPTPAPALPTSDNLGSVSLIQGTTWFSETGTPITAQTQIGAGAEIQTSGDSNTVVGVNYPDNGGTAYLGANTHAGWVYLEPQTDPITGNITYIAVPQTTSYSDKALENEEFGQAGLQLSLEVGFGLGVMLVTGAPLSLGGALVVEGTILLGTGIAYIHEQLSPQEGTYDVRPVAVPQGLVMGDGTDDYVVTVTNESTTIQVMDGSVIFVDQYTNSSITVNANQMLTLPSGVQSGFSQQDLQSDVSAFDASTINQWWIPTPTATPIVATPTATDTLTGNTNPLSSPILLPVIFVVVIIVIATLLTVSRRKKQLKQPGVSTQKVRNQNISQSAAVMPESPKTTAPTMGIPPPPSPKLDAQQPKVSFCPNCGNQLLNTKGFCPFCGSDLSQWSPNAKK